MRLTPARLFISILAERIEMVFYGFSLE
jgi:hypothetical protein